MHMKGCPKSGRMKMTIDTTSYPANPHKVLVRVIFDALKRGRRRNGMSKKSIQNRIEATYRCKLGARFEKELTKSLKRLVRSRHLERIGYRYKAAGAAPGSRGRRFNEALPVTCRCSSETHSRSSSRCPSKQRSCKPYSGISGVTTASSQRSGRCGCRSLSHSSSRSTARCKSRGRRSSRRRSRRGRNLKRRKRGKRGTRKRRLRRGRTRSRSRRRSTSRSRGRSLSRYRIRSSSRTTSVRRMSVSSRRSRSRGRSRTRRTRNMFSSRSQTQSTSRKRRRLRYTWKVRTRSASRSTNGGVVMSPRQNVMVPVPKLDARRGLFEPGVVPAISTAASTSHAIRRASPAPSAVMTRGRAHSPGRGRHHHRSSSVPARSRSRSSSLPPSSPSGFPYLPFLKPSKPALRQSAPQSPDAPDTLTPKSMVKFLTN